MRPLRIAIVGATGLVGRTFLDALDAYSIPISRLGLFASVRSAGTIISFRREEKIVEDLAVASLDGFDYALFSAGASVSKQYAKEFVARGAVVIDNSSAFRMDPTVPLVVPEVNGNDALSANLIANPNCSTIQAVIPLFALDHAMSVQSVVYSTYQSVSGSGQKGLSDLNRTLAGERPLFYPADISKTAIPHIDEFLESGYTKEEMKMVQETKKILHRPDLKVSATCIRVPVPLGHGVLMQVEGSRLPTLTDIRMILSRQEGLVLKDDFTRLEYPLATDVRGSDLVHVGRIRIDTAHDRSLLLYCVADNIRKGAAGNAVQILRYVEEHRHDQSQ